MALKASQKNTNYLSLANKSIYILGSRRFQNEMMVWALERETGAKCLCLENIRHFLSLDNEDDEQPRLVLRDCLGENLKVFFDEFKSDVKKELSRDLLVLFNLSPHPENEKKVVAEGIKGIFYEDDRIDQFLKGVHAIFNGELWISRKTMTTFILDHSIFSQKVKTVLTPREIEIISLVSVGNKNGEIANKLCISPDTVRTHLYKIYKKINVTNRLQATLWAAKHL